MKGNNKIQFLKIVFLRNFHILFFSTLFIITISHTFFKHSKTGYFNYHSQIWGDKSGYYIYLPGLFIYDFKATDLPADIVEKTGLGFSIDSTTNLIKTKYTCGVAIMQSPFYLLNHLTLNLFKKPNDGFQPSNFKWIDFIAVFYLITGLFFLKRFLENYFDNKTTYLSLVILLFTTNLYYYGVYETGMSHIYSFFLVSLFLFLTKQIVSKKRKVGILISYGITIGLIILIRPINAVILSAIFIIDIKSLSDIKTRIIILSKNIKSGILVLISMIIVFIPQLIYWKLTFGKWIYYSYENESFSNLQNPQLLKVWFSTLNGQFLYVPATFLLIVGIFFLYNYNKILAAYSLFLFLTISYLFASWWSWNFGCGFGIRPYVDFLPVFAISLGALVHKVSVTDKLKWITWIALIFFIYSQKLMYSFDGCWYGEIWDWNKFFTWVIR